MTPIGSVDRLLAAITAEADGPTARATAGRLIALGWATVELDRAASEIGSELGIPAERFLGAEESFALGARCRVARDVLSSGVSVVLLEPATEGRLAATLARLGEGPAAVWLAVDDLPLAVDELRIAGVATSSGRTGPFGAERLVLNAPTHAPHRLHGPHRLLVQLPAGTIRS